MAGPASRLILASASPRRRQLLAQAGFDFDVEPADVDETPPFPLDAERCAEALARRKAEVVAARHTGRPATVVGSDTVVAVGEGPETRLLEKPADAAEARGMLEALSESRHRVVTGVCVVRCADGELFTGWERTWVTMRRIAPEEIEAYVASGEWRDKAGGYAIQENADAFVTSLEEGGFDNVVGLPVELTRALLGRAGFPAARG